MRSRHLRFPVSKERHKVVDRRAKGEPEAHPEPQLTTQRVRVPPRLKHGNPEEEEANDFEAAPPRELICLRAQNACEYCKLPQRASILPHQIDHIIARQHLGLDDERVVYRTVCSPACMPATRSVRKLSPTMVHFLETVFAIECAVLDGFGEMRRRNLFDPGQVGDGAGHLRKNHYWPWPP